MKICLFILIVCLSNSLYAADAYLWRNSNGDSKIRQDTTIEVSEPTLSALMNTVCADWVAKLDVTMIYRERTYTLNSVEHEILDSTIRCGLNINLFDYNGVARGSNSHLRTYPVGTSTTYGIDMPFVVGQCEATQGQQLMVFTPVGIVSDINISDTPWLICNNSCSYDLGPRDGYRILFSVTDQVFTDFGCSGDIFETCGAAAPLLATLQYIANGETCFNAESGLTQEELLSNESFNDPCENGPGEYDPECILSGTITAEPQGLGLTIEQIIEYTTFPLIGVTEDASGTTDGWALINGEIDNGTSQYSSGDSSTNFTGDYITQINNYYGDSGGSGGDGSGNGGSSDGDVTVNVDVSGVISAINQSESSINSNIDESQEILNEINDFNNNGLSDFVDPTTLIDDDPNFIERSTKITDIVGGTFKPFGEGWQGVFPTISGTGECPNIDFTIRGISLDLTTEYFCKSMEVITTSLDFIFFFFTIFQVFNLWRTALTEVI
jgi:hypothetical protein